MRTARDHGKTTGGICAIEAKFYLFNEKHDTWLPVDWHTRFMFKLRLVSSCRLCVL